VRVLVTGADGFFGRNLSVTLAERGHEVLPFTRQNAIGELAGLVAQADAVAHLAGANRPAHPEGFTADNIDLTAYLVDALKTERSRRRPIIFASSTQAVQDNPYGASKRAAEESLRSAVSFADVQIYRLPNVFGKWARPFYNSVVATFCHCAARGETLPVRDRSAHLQLMYIDDAVAAFIGAMEAPLACTIWREPAPVYDTSVGAVADTITAIAEGREVLMVPDTGTGLTRALHATFLSHLPTDRFSYPLVVHGDPRGTFVEVVKTAAAGQFSYFTQVAGVRRGGHHHHSKSEKFVVVKGRARFRFRHLVTGERVEVEAGADEPRVVDTIPGWVHDVINLSDEELIVLVWANEVFDKERPDTIAGRVDTCAD